jgi:hypothetical protein
MGQNRIFVHNACGASAAFFTALQIFFCGRRFSPCKSVSLQMVSASTCATPLSRQRFPSVARRPLQVEHTLQNAHEYFQGFLPRGCRIEIDANRPVIPIAPASPFRPLRQAISVPYRVISTHQWIHLVISGARRVALGRSAAFSAIRRFAIAVW